MPPKSKNHKPNATKANKGKEIVEASKRKGKEPVNESVGTKRKQLVFCEESDSSGAENVVFTEKETEDYEAQTTITHLPTHFIRDNTLVKMGIKSDVHALIKNMGLEKFATLKHYVFPGLTRDFLATVDLIYDRPRKPTPDEGYLHFKLHGEAHRVSIKEICEIYGFHYGERVRFPGFKNVDEFWGMIATGTTANSPKISLIRNPALRVTAKFLANTLFARHETGTIKPSELCLLYMGLAPFLEDDSDEGSLLADSGFSEVNLGCIFAKELCRIRTWARKASDRNSHIGGMLPPLWRYLGIPFEAYRCDSRASPMDGRYFTNCGILENVDGVRMYSYLNKNKEKRNFLLPCPEKTSLDSFENIEFLYGEGASSTSAAPPLPQAPPMPTMDMSTWTAPRYDFTPTTAREKALHSILKFHRRVTKMAKKKFDWLERKIRATPGYVSDEHQDGIDEAESEDEENAPMQDRDNDGWDEDNAEIYHDQTFPNQD